MGEIDIELWSKEAPLACRNFIQLCMEVGQQSNSFDVPCPVRLFDRGDPTGTGSGGESIYGETFKDEIHSRLRFAVRGLVAMANGGKVSSSIITLFHFADCALLRIQE
eukprot:758364-Hanusia_phi.AAC.2